MVILIETNKMFLLINRYIFIIHKLSFKWKILSSLLHLCHTITILCYIIRLFFLNLITFQIRDGASRRERENTTTVLAGHVQQLNRDEDLVGFLRRAGHHNDGYVQGIIGPYPRVKIF